MELITHCVKWVIRLNVYKIDWEVPAWNSQSGTDWVWQTRADTPILEAKMTVKILQRLAKKCSTKKLLRNLTQKFGREKLFNTIGKRLQNSNILLMSLKHQQKLQPFVGMPQQMSIKMLQPFPGRPVNRRAFASIGTTLCALVDRPGFHWKWPELTN